MPWCRPTADISDARITCCHHSRLIYNRICRFTQWPWQRWSVRVNGWSGFVFLRDDHSAHAGSGWWRVLRCSRRLLACCLWYCSSASSKLLTLTTTSIDLQTLQANLGLMPLLLHLLLLLVSSQQACPAVPNSRSCLLIIWPRKHKTFVYNLYNVGPTSKTLDRRCVNVIQMFYVCWGAFSVVCFSSCYLAHIFFL